MPIQLDGRGEYNPVNGSLGTSDELVLEGINLPRQNAKTDPSAQMLISSFIEDSVVVDVHFESARLYQEVLDRFARSPKREPLPPSDLHDIAYVSEQSENSRTGVQFRKGSKNRGCYQSIRWAVTDRFTYSNSPGPWH
jgi:hypothetical protein